MRQLFILLFSFCGLLVLQGQVYHQANFFELTTPPPPGTNIYEAKEYINNLPGFNYQGEANEYLEERIDPYMIIPPDGGETGPNPGGSYYVGTIGGSFGVSSTGAATYDIPLVFPPGLASMAPELSLSYNSQGGDGYVGEKWTIGGISSITRTAKTPYYNNGFSGGIKFNSSDQLTLDGQRLFSVGSNEYRTEIDEMSKVVYDFNNSCFTVYTKSGLIKEYGTSTNSKQLLQDLDKPLSWCISKIKDRLGNYIKFNYYNEPTTGEIFIQSIEYTGNNDQTTTIEPFITIKFVYNDMYFNPPAKVFYSENDNIGGDGYFSQVNHLLDKIECYYHQELVKTYNLEYTRNTHDPVVNGPKLVSVTEITGTNKKLSNTSFLWDNYTCDFEQRDEYYNGTYNSPIQTGVGDFTSDGKDEIIVVNNNEYSTSYRICSPAGLFQYYTFTLLPSELKYRGYSIGEIIMVMVLRILLLQIMLVLDLITK